MDLKRLRERTGLTQVEVADLIQIDPSMVSKWENGKIEVPEARAAAVARLYEVPIEEIRQTNSATGDWCDRVVTVVKNPFVVVALLAIRSLRDSRTGVASFCLDSLWERAQVPPDSREAVWAEVKRSGFVRRIGTGTWAFDLVIPDEDE